MPIILIDALAVLATVLFLLRRDLALSVYSLVSLILFLSLSNLGGFMRFVAAIFPIYLFFGLILSDDDWKKNITVGVIAVIVAVQNMYIGLAAFGCTKTNAIWPWENKRLVDETHANLIIGYACDGFAL